MSKKKPKMPPGLYMYERIPYWNCHGSGHITGDKFVRITKKSDEKFAQLRIVGKKNKTV